MSTFRISVCFGLIVVAFALRASDLDETLKKIPAQNAAEREAANGALFKDAGATVQALAKMLVDPGKGDDNKARMALHAMAVHASRPGGDADRKAFAQAAAGQLGDGGNSSGGKIYLLTQLRLTAGDEQATEIAKTLGDTELSEHAAQTLITIGTPAARAALRGALATLKGAPRVTVITALGSLRDKDSVTLIMKDTESTFAEIRDAALHALANIGYPAVTEPLKKAAADAGEGKWYEHNQATQALLTLAQRLLENGDKNAAAALSRDLIKTHDNARERHVQCAALNILAAALGEGAYDDLKSAVKSESVEVRAAAGNIAASLPGEGVTRRWAGEMDGADAKGRVEILQILQKRGDKTGWTAVGKSIEDADKTVRLAALNAAVIGGEDALPSLIAVLKQEPKGNEDEQAAARTALARLRGEKVNAEIAGALKGAPVHLRKALIGALADRAALEHLNILTEATKDVDAGIRAVAFDALGFLGDNKILPSLLDTIDKATEDADRSSAEKAAASIASRKENSAAAIAMIKDFKKGSVKGKQALLRVLGKIGGAEALAVLTPALNDAEADVADVAARELANWPDVSAMEAQLVVAKETKVLPHHVFNIGGYVRLLGTMSKRPAGELLPLYQGVLEACRRPDEKKKVIAGVQGLKSKEALKFLEPLMEDKDLKNEASNAYFNVAKEVVKSDKNAGAAALKKVVETTTNEQRKKDAQGELDKLKK